ncbi:MAG: class I poly(R)-hydroxyalkanoic acid synthase, partial [Cognatishimia sp.]|nr:class I poly(R)-hydroxyalkanoic acid synthase [Cognatishimia sp.]
MTTSEDAAVAKLDKMSNNLKRVEELSQRLIEVMAHHQPMRKSLTGPNEDVFSNAATAYWAKAMENPGAIFEQQMAFWGKSVKHFVEAQHMFAQGKFEPPADNTPQDRRFANPLWQSN